MTYLEYLKVVKLFHNMKVIHGPDFVNSTLNRHVALKRKIIDFERVYLCDLEDDILNKKTIDIKKD